MGGENFDQDFAKHNYFIFRNGCDIINVMGKVIVNEQDATETARNSESVMKSQPEGEVPVERALVKASRGTVAVRNVGENVKTQSKDAAKPEKRIVVTSEKVERGSTVKLTAEKMAQKPATEKASRLSNMKKPATQVKILESTKVAGAKSAAIDPELALMESRAVTAEKSRSDAVKLQKQMNGRVMSDMVRRPMAHHPQHMVEKPAENVAPEEESAFSKMKSALIGVGVAVVVAVIGFVCIGVFGDNKTMCVVQFESNGGTQVEGAEIVCGRTVGQPEDPTKEGFTFQGWMQDGELFNFAETPLYKNAILVARWQANEGTEIVKVKFDTDGGSAMDEVEIAKGAKLHISTVPTKIGYIFDDWYLGDRPFDFEEPVTQDITLKATWTKRPTATDNNNNNNVNDNKPTAVKVASLSASGMTIAKLGDSATVNVSVLPSSAEYSLKVNTASNVVSCSVSGTAVTCTANNYGSATVRVQDTNSGVMTTFSVVVDKPEIEEPKPDDPTPVDPDPPTPVTPSYTLTIRYVDKDGNTVAESHTSSVEKGKTYSVTSPVVNGYTTTETTISGTMGDNDMTVTVTYTSVAKPDPEPTPDPGPNPDAPDTTS